MPQQVAQPGGLRLNAAERHFAGGASVGPLTLQASPGEVIVLLGPSGCGKSTALDLICGLQHADAGTVECSRAALMPQTDALLPWLDAAGNAALPLVLHGTPKAQARANAQDALAQLGLPNHGALRPDELSGGMRQRVAIARTLLSGAPVLCLDEPFAALDAITRESAQQILADALAGSGRTAVLVTHDASEAALLADRVYVLGPQGSVAAEVPGARMHYAVDSPPVIEATRTLRAALSEVVAG